VRDRVVRAQRAHAERLREAREVNARALALAHAIDAELSHITHGSAIVE
jgi:hypothetical protein